MAHHSDQPDPDPETSVQKTILLVNTGSTKKRFILQRMSKLPYKVVVLNLEKNWAEPYVDDWIIADTTHEQQSIEAVLNYSKKHPIDGVVTFWEDDVLLTAKLVDALGVIGISHQIAQRARNKFNFRQFCKDNQLPVPRFFSVQQHTDIAALFAEQHISFPVVVKPALGSSSAYVVKVENELELEKTVKYIQKNVSLEVESALSNGTLLMVEEYIDGDEVDIDILLQNGKVKFWSMSDNFATREPIFVETGEAIPSNLPHYIQKELVDMAELVLEKLGIMNGCIHFEAKYSPQGPVPIEVNLRMGGDEVHSFVKAAWHVDMVDYAVQIALGEYVGKIEKPEKPYTHLAGEYFLPDESGVLASLEHPEKFNADLRVHEFNFYKEVGDTALTPPAAYEYLGWMTVTGDNPNDAADNLEKAREQVTFEIVPFSELSAMGKTKRRSPLSAAIVESTQVKQGEKIARLRAIEVSQQRKLVIGVAYNSQAKTDVDQAALGASIQAELDARGYKTVSIDFANLTTAFQTLQSGAVDFVFNVVEQINGSSLLAPNVSAICDLLKIPYSGSNPLTLALCADKIKVKKLLTYHSIPTASWDYVFGLEDEIDDELKYPLLVKPANTDNSFGITQKSVVENEVQLRDQLEYVLNTLKRPALIEEYLPGDEFIVSIMGNDADNIQVLPLTRLIYDDMPSSIWHINPFASMPDSEQMTDSHPELQHPAKNVSSKLAALVTEMALDAFKMFDVHDYGRVEIKLDENDNPHVLEINPNPHIHQESYMAEAAEMVGLEYGEFLEQIIALTIQRYKNQPPYYHLQSFSL